MTLRKSKNKIISGVCGGLAEYINLNPTWVRIGFATLTILGAVIPGILIYIVLMIIMPPPED